MIINRHERYNQNIVDNLRQSTGLDPTIVPDELLYWAYESWTLSDDYPNESEIQFWVPTAIKEAAKDGARFTFDESMSRWTKWRESH